MPFEESQIQSELRELARRFARNEILPLIEQDEHEERFRPELIAKAGDLGLTGVPVGEAYGGSGLGYLEYCTVLEEIAQVSTAYAISIAVTGLPQIILDLFGTPEQKKKYIPPLASGRGIGSFALSEAASGSDAGALRTTAVREGDDYVLNGTKLWITQADVADVILLMARTGGPGPKGVSAFIVEKGTPGLRMGKREKKMGCHSSHTMEIVLEGVRVPVANRVGEEGDGFKVAMTALHGGRITIAACGVGVAQAALDVAVAHARQREQFGKPIGEFQGVSFMLADMATSIEASRLLVQRAAGLKDAGKPFAQEASMAKLFATDAAMRVTTDAVQVLGGSGYTQEFPVERYMREAKVLQIVEGTNQIQRMIIGRGLLQG
jgi:alkylation response protein AidB-like acyl-CoA dehydrogenase